MIGFRLEAAGPWMVENRDAWKGSPEEELILKVMTKDDGGLFMAISIDLLS